MKDERNGAFGGKKIGRENQIIQRKSVSVPLSAPLDPT
jgi:hypothetical protein